MEHWDTKKLSVIHFFTYCQELKFISLFKTEKKRFCSAYILPHFDCCCVIWCNCTSEKRAAKEYVYTVIYGLLFNQHHRHGVLRHRVFRLGPLIHEHYDNGWAHSGDQSLCVGWCVQLFSFRLSQNQLDARSAAWLSFWIAFRFSLPVVPTDVISRQMDCE